MGFNGEKWWACPKCGSTTKIEENRRECTQCEWSVEIPMKRGCETHG